MFDWMGDDVKWVFSGIGVFVLSILVAVVWHFLKRRSAGHNDRTGGAGGDAEVIGTGEARGGKGGKSGSFGPGGRGGNARVNGSGKAIGGEGGDG